MSWLECALVGIAAGLLSIVWPYPFWSAFLIGFATYCIVSLVRSLFPAPQADRRKHR